MGPPVNIIDLYSSQQNAQHNSQRIETSQMIKNHFRSTNMTLLLIIQEYLNAKNHHFVVISKSHLCLIKKSRRLLLMLQGETLLLKSYRYGTELDAQRSHELITETLTFPLNNPEVFDKLEKSLNELYNN